VNPVPLRVPELMVTGAVPVDVNVTGSVVGVFTVTLPNATLAELMVNVGTAACSCKAKLLETLPALAVRATAWADATDSTLAMNPTMLALAGTINMAGTVTAALLLARLTAWPPLPAGVISVTVQGSLPDPVMNALLQANALTATEEAAD
jgi:hypothetical protein